MDDLSKYMKMKKLGLSPLACQLFSKRFGPAVHSAIDMRKLSKQNWRDARKIQNALNRRLGKRAKPKSVLIAELEAEWEEAAENEDNLKAEIELFSQILAHNEAEKASRQERKQYNLLPVLTEEEMMIEMN